MGGSVDARAALVAAGVVGQGASLSDLYQAGNALYAQLNEVERESEAADAERALDNLAAELEG